MLTVTGFIKIGETGCFAVPDEEKYNSHGYRESLSARYLQWDSAKIFHQYYMRGDTTFKRLTVDVVKYNK